MICDSNKEKTKIFIPCLKTIRDLIDHTSDKNYSTQIFFESLAQEKGRGNGMN